MYSLVTNCDALRLACEQLAGAEAIGVDCETTDLEPHNGRLRLIQLSDGHHTHVIDTFRFSGDRGYEPLKHLLESPRPRVVSHNAKFDQKWLQRFLGIELAGIFDTLLASILIDYTPNTHSLEAVAKTYTDVTIDKSEQKSDWSGELSRRQLEYAARDAKVLVPLRQAMVKRLAADGLVRAARLEFECVPAFAGIELAGIYMDPDRWKEQLASVRAKHARIGDELQDMLSAGAPQGALFGRAEINLDSHTQVATALRQMGVPVDKSTRNNILLPLGKDYPVVAKLLEYRTVSKALTSYGENWLEAINPNTRRVHANFNQIGAPTGRASCLAGETLVSTPVGLKRIDEIRPGDLVETPRGAHTVTAAWLTGKRLVHKITLEGGRTIRATLNHTFLTGAADRWTQLSALGAGDTLYVCLKADEWGTRESAPAINTGAAAAWFTPAGLRPVRIASVLPDREEHVYDLTVEEAHQFIANGVVVHNCQEPNVQQIPRTPEYRRCFRAPEGRKFVIVDFSQIELRILADITRDPGFLQAFLSGADLHKATAASVFKVPPEEVTADQRSFAKRLNFGVVYGIGARRFSNMTGMSLADSEALLARYFQTYPVLDDWLRASSRHAIRHHHVRTLSGRIVRYKFDPEDKKEVSEVKRAARNARVQGSSADIIKRALKLVHDALRGTSARVVNVVHDEIVVECDADEAEEIGAIVSERMVTASGDYIKDVPVKAVPTIADDWIKD